MNHAEALANNVWFLAVAFIFLPLTGKNSVTTYVEFGLKSKTRPVYRFPGDRFLKSLNVRNSKYAGGS